jgi:hypothetical protein
MRKLIVAMLLPVSLSGCATGYATDWFRDSRSIINPQLLRYGLDVEQSRCVGEKLSKRLTRSQLSLLQARAAAVRPAAGATAPLTLGNLRAVASSMADREVRLELDSTMAACNVSATTATAAATPSTTAPLPAAAAAGGATPTGSGPAEAAVTAIPATWLNLGAAESGQSIAIDAMSIQQEGASRTAWFRMTDQSGGGRNDNYRLRIDCDGKTVQPLALRQTDAAGAQTSFREYPPEEATPGPAISGTVLEIAYLSLCT